MSLSDDDDNASSDAGSEDIDEAMEDVDDGDADADGDGDGDGDVDMDEDDRDADGEEDEDNEGDDGDEGDDDDADGDDDGDADNQDNDDQGDNDDDDQIEPDSPSLNRLHARGTRPQQPQQNGIKSPMRSGIPQSSGMPAHTPSIKSPKTPQRSSISYPAYAKPAVRPEALTAVTYDIIPTIAAPQATSINAITATPDMRWVFTGGSDGYIRKFHWPDSVNGKLMLTVAQRHPFVDSVMKAGLLTSYWENENTTCKSHAAE
jgi:transcriptional activator SPT8